LGKGGSSNGPDALPAVTSFEIFCLRISKFVVADGRFLLKRNFLIPIEDAVKLMKFYGKGCLLSKTDIENSFKIIPIHPDDHELLGFPLGDQYYFDKT
jgi:hypothetical protein